MRRSLLEMLTQDVLRESPHPTLSKRRARSPAELAVVLPVPAVAPLASALRPPQKRSRAIPGCWRSQARPCNSPFYWLARFAFLARAASRLAALDRGRKLRQPNRSAACR